MTINGWFQIAIFLGLILAVTKPMGVFLARVFNRERTFMDPVLRPVERLLYRLTGVDEDHEMKWTEYAFAMLLFSVVSMLLLYLIQRVQFYLPWNPQKFTAVSPAHLAFNTAASFTTNTNWQSYSGESTMSYFTQMAGLAYHNFISAATGIALAIAFIRGIARRQMKTIGNFWVDMVRGVPVGAAAVLYRRRTGAGFARRGAKPEALRRRKAGRTTTSSACECRWQAGGRCGRQAGHGYGHNPNDCAGTSRFAGDH